MLDLHTLEQLVTFYHAGTLIEAAEQLHISQSTLTRGMQKVEAEFGVPIFQRTKNSITLTDTGLMAATDAEMLLRQYKNMLYAARDFDRKHRTIMVGSCAPIPISHAIDPLTRLFPDATISSEIKNEHDLLEGLENDTYQLIILPQAIDDPNCHSAPLCSEQIFFCLHKSHRFARRKSLSTKDMNGENMLLIQDIGFWHDLVLQKMPDSRFLMQSERYTFAELVANSTLSFFATEADIDDNSEANRVRIPIEDPEFKVTYYLTCKKENMRRFRALFDAIPLRE